MRHRERREPIPCKWKRLQEPNHEVRITDQRDAPVTTAERATVKVATALSLKEREHGERLPQTPVPRPTPADAGQQRGDGSTTGLRRGQLQGIRTPRRQEGH